MSNVQIPNLPAASGLSGTEQLEGVQSGTSVRLNISQIAAYVSSTYPAPGISSVTATSPLNSTTVSGAVTISLPSGSVTNATLAPMANGRVKGNVSGGSASPSDITPSQVLDVIGSTKGMLLYRDTSSWAALSAGSNGQILTAQGSGAVPIWQNLSVPSGSIQPTGVVAGTYGSASTVPQYTVLASGQLSAASNVPIVIPNTSVTGLGTMSTQNANNVAITGGNIDGTPIGLSTPSTGAFTSLSASGSASFATISSGTWNGSPIAVLYGGTGATTASGARTNLGAASSGANSDITSLSGLTTPLSAPQGGTGFGSYTTGDILYADTSSTLARLNDVATGNALISGGVGVAPSWGKIGLTTHVSGTLPVANGGSGAATLTGFLKGNGTSPFTAQATIDNADLTNSSLTVGSTTISLGGTSTTLAGLTTVTLTQDPTLALQAATKQYVDNEVLAVSNTTFHAQSGYATTADLGSVTYSNGTGGVGATITQSGAASVLIIDGYTFTATDVTNATRVLVKNQSSGLQNGIYTVTNQGSGAANWQLTRATDFDTVGTGPTRVQTGASTFVTGGAANGSTGWVMNTTGTITIGTTSLVWVQSSSSASVTVTSPLQKVGSVISLTTVPVNLGGTNLTSYTQYELLYAPTSGSIGQISAGTAGYPLLSGGAGAAPAFNQLSLSGSGVTGTLPVTSGGSGTATAFTAGSVVFAGASGVYSQENAEFFWDNTNDFLGLGTAVPDARLTITAPTQTAVTAGTLPAGTDLHIVGADSAITRITQDAFGTGNYPAYTGRAARGTAAAPTASQAGDVLSQYGGRGHGATAYSSTSVGRIDIEAAENFTDTAQGSYISLHTTALGSASPVERFRAGPAGQWGIGGATYGTSGQVFTSGGASAAPTWSDISVTTVTGTLPVANGGTGLTSYTIGDLIYADGATSLAKLADVATGNALISGGIGVAPSWGKIGLSTHVSGTLPIGSGGTGVTGTPTNGQLLIGNGTGYSLSTLTAGSGNFTVTNGSGTITLDINSSPTLTGLTVNGSAVISTSSASDALRITQTGAGNALLVEDSTNPDATPFVVNNAGQVLIGSTTAPFGPTDLGLFSNTVHAVPPYQDFFKNRAGAIVASGDVLGRQRFWGYDGAAYLESARIDAVVDTTPGSNDMPGSLRFYTTADGASSTTERMRIDNAGRIGFNSTSLGGASGHYRFAGNITGAASSSGIVYSPSIQSDVTSAASVISSLPSTQDAAFTLTTLQHFVANQGTITGGSRTAPTNQYGFVAQSTLTGATNNYGFLGNIASGTGRYNFYAAGTADNYFAGNVGIGTSSPSGRLHVRQDQDGTTRSILQNRNASGTPIVELDFITGAYDLSDNRYAYIQSGGSANQYLAFGNGQGASPTEKMRIDSAGNVGIGTSSPGGYKLNVSGTALVTSSVVTNSDLQVNPSGYNLYLRNIGGTNRIDSYNSPITATVPLQLNASLMTFYIADAEKMRIDSSGNVGIGTGASALTKTLTVQASEPIIQLVDSDSSTRVANIGGQNGNVTIDIDPAASAASSQFAVNIDNTERFRIASSGQIGIGGANYGTSGQVLTSNGAAAAPSWQTVSGGVTSLTAGNGITVSASTGAVTVSQDIYTGTSSTNTTYPIGSYVSALIDSAATSTTMNSSRTLYAGSGTVYNPTNVVSGSALTGTWRSRGWTRDSSCNNTHCLFQRTA